MKAIRPTRDLVCGLMLVAVAVFFLFASQSYSMGTPTRMGPAFFPVMLATLLGLVGLALCIRGVTIGRTELVEATVALRPIVLVLASIGVFGLLLRPAGLVLALAVSLGVAVLAQQGRKWAEALATVAVLVIFGAVLFHGLLRISVGLWPAFLS